MGLLDDLITAFARVPNRIDGFFETITNPQVDDEQASDVIGDVLEDVQPADEISGVLVDVVEEAIQSDLEEAGELTPENIESIADRTEGSAVAVLAGLGLAGSVVEGATAGQVDQQQEYITQAVAALGVEDVTGTELEARMREGMAPALEAKVGKEHRAKFVSLQDAVEYLLRHKTGDEGWLQGENVDPPAFGKVQSNDPVNPQNAVEEWGIRDDQLDILEGVALEAMEFEELIETPAELGIIVDDEVLDEVLDLAGYPESLKDFLRQVPDEIPRSNRLWEERTAVEPMVKELEKLTAEEEISPADAIELIPDEAEEAKPALRDRFENLQDLPAGSPTRSLFEGSFASGFSDVATFEDRLERLEFDTDRYDDVVDKMLLDELDGDLQQAVGLGLVSEAQYGELMDRVGLDAETQQALLAGQSLDDVAEARLQESGDASARPVAAIPGIGQSRSTALAAIDIETLADMAEADPETVAEAAQVSPETAQEFITLARQATQ